MEFLSDADIYLKTFWYIAIPVSTLFLIQSIFTIMGAGANDMDSDMPDIDSPMELFTLRNFINFLLGFSWAGISFYNTIPNKFWLVSAAISVGVTFVAFFFYIIQQIKKLEQNNSFTIDKALDKKGTVYLRIPSKKSGKGIIQVSVKGTVHELDAITDKEEIETGANILITGLTPEKVLIVKKI